MSRQGHFVWHELVTTDVEAARLFYTDVVGWRTQPGESGGRPYTMWLAGDAAVGGVTTLAPVEGAAPHWLSYVSVENLDTSQQRVVELGGKVLDGPHRIEEGTILVCSDPTGAVIALLHPETQEAPSHEGRTPELGDVTWNELNTTDWDRARIFYDALLGWREQSRMELPDGMGTYWMFQAPGSETTLGGMSSTASAMKLPPHWLPYFYVGDIEPAVARVESGGGKVLDGPMEIPGGDRVAQCTDPQGAVFAIHGT